MTTLKQQVVSLVKLGAFEDAVRLARDATDKDPASAESWAVLSHACEITGDIESAIQSSNRAIDLEPGEPAHRFQRGWLYLLVDCSQEALDEMSTVISMCQELSNDFYKETAVFLAAESLRRMHRYREAIDQCENVRVDFSIHIGAPLSKQALVVACQRALRHTETMSA